MRILILEDEPDSAKLLGDLFAIAGHETAIARDGNAGLVLLSSQDFDGVLLDLVLPRTNGWEFLDAMDLGTHVVPVIVVSGYADVEPPSPYHHVPVVRKPYAFPELLALCEKNFGGSKPCSAE